MQAGDNDTAVTALDVLGTDYQFTVKGRGPNGAEATSTIYVVVGNEPGAKPEFTQVVR